MLLRQTKWMAAKLTESEREGQYTGRVDDRTETDGVYAVLVADAVFQR